MRRLEQVGAWPRRPDGARDATAGAGPDGRRPCGVDRGARAGARVDVARTGGASARRVGVGLALAGSALLLLPVREQLSAPRPHGPPAFPDLARSSGVEDPVAAQRHAVLAFLAENGRPGDPLFVGSVDHRFIFVNEMDLYFLADRVGSTRYMQFDPTSSTARTCNAR